MAEYTISDYLRGVVRGTEPTDSALKGICLSAGIDDPSASYADLSLRQQRLALAFLYMWIATGPSGSEKWSEKDGDWSQSGGGASYSRDQIRLYIRLANDIFDEYGLDRIGNPVWGFRGGGIRNIRRTRNGRHI